MGEIHYVLAPEVQKGKLKRYFESAPQVREPKTK